MLKTGGLHERALHILTTRESLPANERTLRHPSKTCGRRTNRSLSRLIVVSNREPYEHRLIKAST